MECIDNAINKRTKNVIPSRIFANTIYAEFIAINKNFEDTITIEITILNERIQFPNIFFFDEV